MRASLDELTRAAPGTWRFTRPRHEARNLRPEYFLPHIALHFGDRNLPIMVTPPHRDGAVAAIQLAAVTMTILMTLTTPRQGMSQVQEPL